MFLVLLRGKKCLNSALNLFNPFLSKVLIKRLLLLLKSSSHMRLLMRVCRSLK